MLKKDLVKLKKTIEENTNFEARVKVNDIHKKGRKIQAYKGEGGKGCVIVRYRRRKKPKISKRLEIAKFTIREETPETKRASYLYQSKVKYDFLQFYPFISRFMAKRYKMSSKVIDLLIFLYPIGVFTRKEFDNYILLGSSELKSTLKTLLKKNLVQVWNNTGIDDKVPTYYMLTKVAREMCADIHAYCAGDRDIPKSYIGMYKSIKDKVEEIITTANKRTPN